MQKYCNFHHYMDFNVEDNIQVFNGYRKPSNILLRKKGNSAIVVFHLVISQNSVNKPRTPCSFLFLWMQFVLPLWHVPENTLGKMAGKENVENYFEAAVNHNV